MRSSKGTNRNSPAKGYGRNRGTDPNGAHRCVGDFRFHCHRSLLIGAAGKTREALLTKQNGEGVDADGMTGGGEFALHVIDREIALAHGHRQITDAIAGGRGLGSALWQTEERSAFLRIVAELITQDAERAWGITEAAGDVG